MLSSTVMIRRQKLEVMTQLPLKQRTKMDIVIDKKAFDQKVKELYGTKPTDETIQNMVNKLVGMAEETNYDDTHPPEE